MVEVVAEVLEEHCIDDDEICPCGCDVRDSETRFLRTHELRIAHQARAVLAALTEAGSVEWGVEHEGEVMRFVHESNAHISAIAHRPARCVVSRLALPWTKVQ